MDLTQLESAGRIYIHFLLVGEDQVIETVLTVLVSCKKPQPLQRRGKCVAISGIIAILSHNSD